MTDADSSRSAEDRQGPGKRRNGKEISPHQLNEGMGHFFKTERSGMLAMSIDEQDDAVLVQATMPGVPPERIQLRVAGDTLTIDAEVQEERKEQHQGYFVNEQRYGRFSRSVRLPAEVEAEQAEAHLEDGVLHIHLPKAAQALRETINEQNA